MDVGGREWRRGEDEVWGMMVGRGGKTEESY